MVNTEMRWGVTMPNKYRGVHFGMLALVMAVPGQAKVNGIRDIRTEVFTQSASGATAANARAAFDVYPEAGDTVLATTVTPPGGTPFALATNPYYASTTFYYPSAAAMQQALPNGTYQEAITTVNYGLINYTPTFTAGLRPTVVPVITNFAALLAVDPTQDFTININPFTSDGYGQSGYFFISVLNGGPTVYNGTLADLFAGSFFLPANTLQAGASYGFQLQFTNYQSSSASDGSSINNIYNRIDLGTFQVNAASPGIPEPSAWMLLIAGFGVFGVSLRRRGAASSMSDMPLAPPHAEH